MLVYAYISTAAMKQQITQDKYSLPDTDLAPPPTEYKNVSFRLWEPIHYAAREQVYTFEIHRADFVC